MSVLSENLQHQKMGTYRHYLLAVLVLSIVFSAKSQHHHEAETGHTQDTLAGMSHTFSLNLPMNRNGSGTAWLPDATPVYAWMKHGRSWNYMLHAGLFLRYNMQNLNNDFRRGGKQFDAPNWLMGMAQRRVGERGLLLLRGMLSLDAITVGGKGYPLLFQTGETWQNEPLIDLQHPHDLVSELAVGYTWSVGPRSDISLYAAYPGEPALGPSAFMHRISSMNNPDSPLGHHWQDATHITFGVATVGVRWHIFKVEASTFTGREPDENRYTFDNPTFDSYSYRLSVNPSQNFSLQVSQGFLKSPEALRPEEDVVRTTASVIYSMETERESYVTSALVWGYNDAGGHHKEHSVLLENAFQINRWALYGRFEWIQKSSEELALTQFDDETFEVNAFTLGANYQLPIVAALNTAIGGQVTLNAFGDALKQVYGNNPVSAEIYMRIVPSRMRTDRTHHHAH